MSDPNPLPPEPPSYLARVMQSLAQKAAAIIVGALLTDGVVEKTDVAKDTSLIAGGIVLVGSIAWTLLRDYLQHRREKALAAAAGLPPK